MDAMRKMGDFTNTVAKPFDQLTEAILDINNPERWKEFGVRVQTEGNKIKLSFRDMTVECDRTVESVMKAVEQFGSMKGVEGSTEAISKTIEGQMSNLEDTITTALAEIGLANQGLISGSISAVDTIVKNYDIIGKSILALIEIYGVYRAGLLINTIVEQGSVKSIWAKIAASKAATIAQAAYNKVLAMNPYVAVGMAVVSLGVAMRTLADNTSAAEKAQNNFNDSIEHQKDLLEKLKRDIDQYITIVRDETSSQYDKIKAYEQLKELMPVVFSNMDIEKLKLMNILSLNEQISNEIANRERIGAKTSLVLREKELESVSLRLDNAIERQAQSPTAQNSAVIDKLQNEKKRLEKEVELAKKNVDKIIELQNKTDKSDTKSETKNKSYWTNQKKEAETALNSIASAQKKLMDAGKFDGIDDTIVKSYKDNVKKLKEAEKELKVYDSSSKQENQADKLRKEQEKLNEQLLSLRRKNQQDEINLMEEGTEKKLHQINLDYQKEFDAIKKQRKEWENAQNGKLTEEQTLVITLREELAGKKKDSDTSKVHEEEVKEYQKLLSSYQDYLAKRKNAEDKFNADRKKLKDGGASDVQINELEYQREETLQSIDNEFAMREDSFKAWADNIADLSLEKLRELLVQAEQELQRSEFLNPNNPQLAGQRAKVTSLKNTVSEKAAKNNTSPDKRSKKEWQDLYSTLSKVEREFDEIGRTVGGTVGEIISAAGTITTSTLQMIDGITTLANSSSDAMAGTAQAASKSIQAVEKASVILAIVGAALQITMKMFDLFGGDDTTEKYEKTKETYESYINILDKVIDKQLELAESLYGDNANAAYEKAIELVKTQSDAARVLGKQYLNSGSSWKSHSKGYSEVDDMSWEGWNDAAKALGMSVDQFKSKMGGRMEGLFDLTDEQLEKLQAEAHIFWAQLDSDTQNYANQIAEGVGKVAEVMEQRMTDTTLIDVDTLRSDFQNLLTDMDANSADFADNFEEYMRNAILNSMLKESYMGRLEEWRKKFYAAMDDGVTEQEYNDLKEEGQQIADDMKAEREAMADMFGWKSESSSQEATAKGFQAMSQDTGEELNGRFTALQISGEEIKNQNTIQSQSLNLLTAKADTILSINTETRNIADDTRDLIAQSYLELVQISENTGNSAKYLKDIKADIAEVKRNTSKL